MQFIIKNKILFSAILLIFSIKSFAQIQKIDSLVQKANKSGCVEKVMALTELCEIFYKIDQKKGINYGQEALKTADFCKNTYAKSKILNAISMNYWAAADYQASRLYANKALSNASLFQDSIQIAKSYKIIGLSFENSGNFDSCIFFFNKELIILRRLKDEVSAARSLDNIGTIFMNCGELKSALTNLLEAKSLFEKNNKINALALTSLKISSIYQETRDYADAEKFNMQALENALALKDSNLIGMCLNTMGVLFKMQGKNEDALKNYNKALLMVKNQNNKLLLMSIHLNISNVLILQEKFDDALKFSTLAFELALAMKNTIKIAIVKFTQAECYLGKNEYLKAKTLYEEALQVFHKAQMSSYILKAYFQLIKTNKALKNFEQAVKYYDLYIPLKDSLYKKELNTELDSLKVMFRTEQIDKENSELIQKTELQKKTIFTQKVILYSSLIFLSLLIIIVFIIIKSRKSIKKINHLLEQKNIEITNQSAELSIKNAKLVELSKFKDIMNSFLVHDLKNPLNTIININSNANVIEQFNTVKKAGKQMLNLVLNLLDISKYENKSLKLSFEESFLSQIINNAFTNVTYLASQKSIAFRSQFITDYKLNIDTSIIDRVFVNIFSNAINFSKSGSNIDIFADVVEGNFLKIIVKDYGEGIDAEFLPHIFDRFSQAKKAQTRLTSSTGIGLTFCKMAIEAHSGQIGVDSETGKGSSFWFTLPLSKKQENENYHKILFTERQEIDKKINLEKEEINFLMPYCLRLEKLSIYQISDVKDLIEEINEGNLYNVAIWKSEVLKALYDCNKYSFEKLINMIKK